MTNCPRFRGLLLALAGLLWLTSAPGCKDKRTPPATQPAGTQPPATQPTQGTDPNVCCPNLAAPEGELDSAEAVAIRKELLSFYKLKGKVSLIQFGLVGYPLTDEGLEGMILHERLDDLPGLAMLRVEFCEDQAKADAYYKDKEFTFPVHRDPKQKVARAFGALSDPTYVIVDKFGRIRYRGAEPDDRLGDWVEQLQAQTADAGPDQEMLGVVKLDGAKLLAETTLPDLGGEPVALADCMGPNGLVVVLVDTVCPFCGKALGDMPQVAVTLIEAQVASIIINIDGSKDRVTAFYGEKDLGAPVIFDETEKTLKAWNITSVPRVFYITPEKEIAYEGGAVWSKMGAAIEQARQLPPGSIRFTVQGTGYG